MIDKWRGTNQAIQMSTELFTKKRLCGHLYIDSCFYGFYLRLIVRFPFHKHLKSALTHAAGHLDYETSRLCMHTSDLIQTMLHASVFLIASNCKQLGAILFIKLKFAFYRCSLNKNNTISGSFPVEMMSFIR